MADLRISELPAISGPDVQPAVDAIAVADISASETKKATATGIVQAALGKTVGDGGLSEGVILADKIKWDSLPAGSINGDGITTNSLSGDRLVDGSIPSAKIGELDTANISDGAITTLKIAPNAVTTSIVGDSQITSQKLATDAAIGNITDGSLNGGKLIAGTVGTTALTDGSVSSVKLASGAALGNLVVGSIDTSLLSDGAVTEVKVGDGQITSLKLGTDAAIGNITDGSLNGGKLVDSSVDGGAKLAPGSVTAGVMAGSSIATDSLQPFAVTEGKLASDSVILRTLSPSVVSPNGGLTLAVDGIAIDNAIVAGSYAGIAYNDQGLITGIDPSGTIPSTDLPLATTTVVGAVSVPTGSGLSVSGTGELTHTNTVTATSYAGLVYDEHGHIQSSSANGIIPSASLPVAGNTDAAIGAVYVPGTGNLMVGSDGKLSHVTTTVAGTYTKVQVDSSGHVIDAFPLSDTDIPNLSADKITSGSINPNVIAEKSITREMLADYAITYIQEAEPTSTDPGHIGCLWFQESTAQLRMWNGNSWNSVGFGRLSQDNLRWGGIVDATTGLITKLTSAGLNAGLTVGTAIPAASDPLGGVYLLCSPGGNNIGVLPSVTFDEGDWVLCINETEGWVHIDNVGGGGGSGGATTLGGLLDVTITTPAEGDFLSYNSTSGIWENVSEIDCGTF